MTWNNLYIFQYWLSRASYSLAKMFGTPGWGSLSETDCVRSASAISDSDVAVCHFVRFPLFSCSEPSHPSIRVSSPRSDEALARRSLHSPTHCQPLSQAYKRISCMWSYQDLAGPRWSHQRWSGLPRARRFHAYERYHLSPPRYRTIHVDYWPPTTAFTMPTLSDFNGFFCMSFAFCD